ncbi:MAG: hypothetical protein ACKV2T_26210 [Kofleriaceae bacterium]
MKRRIYKLLAVVTFVGASTTSALAAPRTLANGAPAPGNTVAKGETRFERTESSLRAARGDLADALVAERTAAADLQAQPRTLANGAPACGNTGGKAPACTVERSDQLWKNRVERLVQAGVRVRALQAHVALVKKAYVKRGGTDPALLAAVAPPSEASASTTTASID